jgi:hypothetical protein
MPMPWTIPANFSGAKFAARYSLTKDQFYLLAGQLYVRSGVTVPDPPIMDEEDTPAVKAAAKNLTDRTGASDRFVSGIDLEAKALRALALIVLDEINTIRTNAALGLAPRTLAQLKTAFTNKLNAGSAD